MNWYYTSNNTQKGPVSAESLKEKIASGEVKPSDLVWKDGMGDWTPASRVSELANSSPSTSYSAPTEDSPPSIAPTNNPYQSPSVGTSYAPQIAPGYEQKKTGLAIASMVTGICGIVLTCCMPYVSVLIAIAAIVLGHIAHSKIKKSPQQYAGSGMKTAGLIMGYLGLVFSALFLIYFVFVFTNDPNAKRSWQEMMKQFENAKQSQQSSP